MIMVAKKTNQTGTALLTLVIFVAASMLIIGGAVMVSIIGTQETSKISLGEKAYHLAEAGIENAVIRLLRDPSYAGETLTVDDGIVTISVSGLDTKIITAESQINELKRKIQVIGTYEENRFVPASWKEID